MKSCLIIFLLTCINCSFCSSEKEEMKEENAKEEFKFVHNIDSLAVPIEIIRGRMHAKGLLNDSILTDLLLDSASDVFSLDYDFVENNKNKLGVVIGKTSYHYPTLNSVFKSFEVKGKSKKKFSVKIGNETFLFDHFLAVKGAVRNLFPMRMLGDKYIVNIDLPNNRLALLDSIENKSDTISFTLNKYTKGPEIYSTLKIQGEDTTINLTGKFVLDYGFHGSVIVSRQFPRNYPDLTYNEIHTLSPRSKNGYYVDHILLGRKIVFNGVTLPKTDITVNFFIPEDVVGIIGMGILKYFNLAFDYKNEQLHFFIPDSVISLSKEPYIPGIKWGVMVDSTFSPSNKHLLISKIFKGRQGDLQNVKPGDKVIQVNDKEITQENFREIFPTIKNADSLKIVGKDGIIKDLK